MKKIFFSLAIALFGLFAFSVPAYADNIPAIDFESPYTIGNINSQQGWMKTGPYDVAVVAVSGFSNASTFGFETQALRISNAITSGSFGDQTFSPGLLNPSGEATSYSHFEASFEIGSTQAGQQPGLFLSVSPDDGNGSRMSYVGFRDDTDGIHVIFFDVTNPGPLGSVASFNPTDVVTIDRISKHSIKFVIDFVPGPANDDVKLYVDNVLEADGTTWEDYYRYDPEQTGNGNQLFPINKLLFRVGGTAAAGTSGNGYLVDNVSLMSGAAPFVSSDYKDFCKKDGWRNYQPLFKNQGQCVSSFASGKYLAFVALDSIYNNGPLSTSPLYATGAFNFFWDKNTGEVKGGYYDEIYPAVTGLLYHNVVTGGLVIGNTVNLNFHRDSDNYSFTSDGILLGQKYIGTLAGPYYFTATGN